MDDLPPTKKLKKENVTLNNGYDLKYNTFVLSYLNFVTAPAKAWPASPEMS